MLIDCSAHMGSPQESRGLTECVSRRSQADVLMQSSVSVTELLLKVNVKCVWTLEERKKEEEKPHRRLLFAHLWFPDDEPWRPELHRNSSTFVLQDEFHSHYHSSKLVLISPCFWWLGDDDIFYYLQSAGLQGWTLGFGEELQDQGCLVHETDRWISSSTFVASAWPRAVSRALKNEVVDTGSRNELPLSVLSWVIQEDLTTDSKGAGVLLDESEAGVSNWKEAEDTYRTIWSIFA